MLAASQAHALPRLPVVRSVRVLASTLLLCASAAQAAPTGLLNDTGQTLCANLANNAMEACSSTNTGNASAQPRQDGRFGRDRASPTKVGGGAAGFDFTRVCFNGDLQGAGTCTGTLVSNDTGTASGTAATDWACTKDNVTNLIWSLQTQSATWNAATVSTYPDAGHNTAIRCGFSTGWRLPTRRELLSIVNLDGRSPAIDSSYFPGTNTDLHWSSDAVLVAGSVDKALDVGFSLGDSLRSVKTFAQSVRLVRSGL